MGELSVKSSLSDILSIESSVFLLIGFSVASVLKSIRGAYGCNLAGSSSGKSKFLTRNTTKCIAVENSASDKAPSLVTSDSSQIFESSFSGSLDLSKNGLATEPVMKPLTFGCIILNCFS